MNNCQSYNKANDYSEQFSQVHYIINRDALCTWVNRGGQLKAELQLPADMICRQSAAKRVTYYPIPVHSECEKEGERKRVVNQRRTLEYLKQLTTPMNACLYVCVYPMACFSKSLCTGTDSFPRKRLIIGRLLANLSFTSISRTSVGRDTKLNLWGNQTHGEGGLVENNNTHGLDLEEATISDE